MSRARERKLKQMPKEAPRLSKSRVQSGAQCPLKLWYDCYERELAAPPDEGQQFVFDRGTRIGELAQERYAGGKLIEAEHFEVELALSQTAKALLGSSVKALFEPAFLHRGVLARVDVLQRAGAKEWDLIEVKSGTKPKDVYLRDLAIQLWIARGVGLRVRKAGLLLLNREYVYGGKKLDLDQLFTFVDLSAEALVMHDKVEQLVTSLQKMLVKKNPPEIEPGPQCSEPYDCPYYDHCSEECPSLMEPIAHLPRLHITKRALLEEMGVEEIHDIPEDFELNEVQSRVRDCVMTGDDWASSELKGALEDIKYPVHHLDFEAFMPAVPLYAGTSPYDAVPFQYSIHRQSASENIKHLEYLYTDDGDPQRELAERLLFDLGRRGSICVYSSYEKGVITRLAAKFPDLRSALMKLVDRLWDLLPIIRAHYYHPDFHGSFSIKAVLPALVPALSYADLEIGDGMLAANLYETARTLDDEAERQKIYDNLREYCGQDTWAMVELRRVLGERALVRGGG